MTIDDWRARYDHLNAETDRLRAEVKRLREEAERARSTVEWHAEGGATKNGLYLWAGPVVNGFASLVQRGRRRLYLDWHPSLEAARSAAVAWVDQQEGRDV